MHAFHWSSPHHLPWQDVRSARVLRAAKTSSKNSPKDMPEANKWLAVLPDPARNYSTSVAHWPTGPAELLSCFHMNLVPAAC